MAKQSMRQKRACNIRVNFIVVHSPTVSFATHAPSSALVNALNRLVTIRSLGIRQLPLAKIPLTRLKALSRTALTVRTQALARMPSSRRTATLVAFAYVMESIATDDALDVLELLFKDLLSCSAREGKKERLRTLKDQRPSINALS